MRTYTRRRPMPMKIEDVLHRCRLCLEKSETAIPIFTEETRELCPLVLRIMVCIGLEVAKDESLPNTVCATCHTEIEKYYAFRKKCASSYQKLKSHLQAVRKIIAENTKHALEEYSKENAEKREQHANLRLDCEKPSGSEENDDNSMFTVVSLGTDSFEKGLLQGERLDETGCQFIMQIVENKEVNHYEDNDNFILQIMEGAPEETPSKFNATNASEKQNTEIQPEQTGLDLDMNEHVSDYLRNILSELGIISEAGGFVRLNHRIGTMELETKDGVVTLALSEEEENPSVKMPVCFPSIIKRKNAPMKKTKEKLPKTKPAVYKCGECTKTFASAGVLRRHERTHRGDKPHACRTCGRRFTQKEVRNRHELVHREKRPFQCNSCEKSFTQRAGLEQHSRVHAPQQPLRLHACTYCDKIFLHQSGLSRHMTSHKGVKHTCPCCHKEFSDKSSLHRHVKTHAQLAT